MTEDLELYIHIPFCVRKCNYCDFLSFPASDSVHEEYIRQLIKELKYMSQALHAAVSGSVPGSRPGGAQVHVPGLSSGKVPEPAPESVTGAAPVPDEGPSSGTISKSVSGYTVRSVFIGGGTPTVMDEYLISDILTAVFRYYDIRKDAEITIECNPSSVLRHKFAVYKRSGVNRLSIGLQSADNAELRMLGRPHTFEEFLKTYQSARMEGFGNINIDLMNCFPMQSLRTWKKTLRSVCMLKPEHISVYNMIIEEGTPFYDMREKGLLLMPSEDDQAAIDSYTRECLARYGYRRYEFSNYAKPGHECIHNKGYWQGIPYIGFGLGASSYFGGYRWKNITDIDKYMALDLEHGNVPVLRAFTRADGEYGPHAADGLVRNNNSADAAGTGDSLRSEITRLTREDRMEEYIYLGMRLTDGISANGFKSLFGVNIEDIFGEVLEKYISLGFIEKNCDKFRLTECGIDISNVILSDFLLH